MDPNRISFDASAYPSLAELVIRYADSETRRALLIVSISWHKEVNRVRCHEAVGVRLLPHPCGWRGICIQVNGFPLFRRDWSGCATWTDSDYLSINVHHGYSLPLDGPAPSPRLSLHDDNDEGHDRDLFNSVRPRTAAQLKNFEASLHQCKTVTIAGSLSPLSYRFLQRYKFSTVQV